MHYLAGHLQSGLKLSGSTAACRNNIQLFSLLNILGFFMFFFFVVVVGIFLSLLGLDVLVEGKGEQNLYENSF